MGERDSHDDHPAGRVAGDHWYCVDVECRGDQPYRRTHRAGLLDDAGRRHGTGDSVGDRRLLLAVPCRDRAARAAAGRCRGGRGACRSESCGLLELGQSLIPTNPMAAAANGAMLPLVVFTLAFAIALTRVPAEGRDAVLRFFQGLGDAMLVLVGWIIWLAPAGVFVLMLSLGAHGGAGLVGAIGFYIAAYSIACIIFVLLLYPTLAIAARLPMPVFARAALPA